MFAASFQWIANHVFGNLGSDTRIAVDFWDSRQRACSPFLATLHYYSSIACKCDSALNSFYTRCTHIPCFALIVLIYIAAASIGGSWLVQIAGSVGASVIYSLTHFDTYNVFTSWSLYVCIVVIGVLAVYQVLTTNRALADHGAGIVMPIFFVFFTTATMITFAVLFAGSPSVPGVQVATLVVGFLVISCGVAILYSFNLRALPKRVVELLTGEEEEECEEEDVEMELVKKPEDEEVEITSPSGTLAEVGSSQGILAPVSSAVGLAPPPMPLRGGVSEVSVVSDEPRRRHTSFGGTLHARTVSGGNAANSPVESAGSGTISRGRKVSMSGQSVLGLSRKNTVGYALDVLSSHAWELDENLLKEKYNMGIGTQERGSLKRKVPRVGSSASIDWRDSRALERSGTVGSMVVVEEPDHDDDDLERGDREQSGRDQGGQAGPSDR